MIPYGRQEINQADIDAVVEVLQPDYLTQGPKVPLFEKTVATTVGAEYAVAANSATSALHIACLALGMSILPVTHTGTIPRLVISLCTLRLFLSRTSSMSK